MGAEAKYSARTPGRVVTCYRSKAARYGACQPASSLQIIMRTLPAGPTHA